MPHNAGTDCSQRGGSLAAGSLLASLLHTLSPVRNDSSRDKLIVMLSPATTDRRRGAEKLISAEYFHSLFIELEL